MIMTIKVMMIGKMRNVMVLGEDDFEDDNKHIESNNEGEDYGDDMTMMVKMTVMAMKVIKITRNYDLTRSKQLLFPP